MVILFFIIQLPFDLRKLPEVLRIGFFLVLSAGNPQIPHLGYSLTDLIKANIS
jgi:predicted cation transporter